MGAEMKSAEAKGNAAGNINGQNVAKSKASPPAAGSEREQIREEISQALWLAEHQMEYIHKLLANIKERLPQLEELLVKAEDHWGMEDGVYRFYHQSFKVYGHQKLTERICKALPGIAPGSAHEQVACRGNRG